jgi:16S rRNA G966 N2-methylase RsmD
MLDTICKIKDQVRDSRSRVITLSLNRNWQRIDPTSKEWNDIEMRIRMENQAQKRCEFTIYIIDSMYRVSQYQKERDTFCQSSPDWKRLNDLIIAEKDMQQRLLTQRNNIKIENSNSYIQTELYKLK